MLWLNANRDKIRSDSPGMSVTDVSKKAGELWKGMSKEKKEVSWCGPESHFWGMTMSRIFIFSEKVCYNKSQIINFLAHSNSILIIRHSHRNTKFHMDFWIPLKMKET